MDTPPAPADPPAARDAGDSSPDRAKLGDAADATTGPAAAAAGTGIDAAAELAPVILPHRSDTNDAAF